MTDNAGQAAPGWYPDPSGAPRQRYFDGEVWTDHYHDEAPAAGYASQGAQGAPGGYGGYAAPQPAPSPIDCWKKVLFENYANFSGRARRAEYWWTYLINLVALLVIAGVSVAVLGEAGLVVYVLAALAIVVPQLAVGIRRLHDTGKSGWYLLVAFVPFVGGIILIVFLATDGERGPNQYGPSPKY